MIIVARTEPCCTTPIIVIYLTATNSFGSISSFLLQGFRTCCRVLELDVGARDSRKEEASETIRDAFMRTALMLLDEPLAQRILASKASFTSVKRQSSIEHSLEPEFPAAHSASTGT